MNFHTHVVSLLTSYPTANNNSSNSNNSSDLSYPAVFTGNGADCSGVKEFCEDLHSFTLVDEISNNVSSENRIVLL